jgi:lysozyme
MNMDMLLKQLIKHEGLELNIYTCPAGKKTIGVGRNLEDRGITKKEAMFLLRNDIDISEDELSRYFDFYDDLSDIRQNVLLNMHFNLGFPTLFKFEKFIGHLEDKNYLKASKEMLDSKWARQVGNRALELSEQMLRGR